MLKDSLQLNYHGGRVEKVDDVWLDEIDEVDYLRIRRNATIRE